MFSRGNQIFYPLLFMGVSGLFCSGGALLVTLFADNVESQPGTIAALSVCTVLSSLLMLLAGYRLMRGHGPLPSTSNVGDAEFVATRRHLLFSLLLFLLIVAVSLLSLNLTASFFSVSWPINGLHGVHPKLSKQAWSHFADDANTTPVNSWGQRDDETVRKTEKGTYRIIFVGDSFLEEGAPIPLPIRTEDILNVTETPAYEIINLGVSATAPDEYYFRIKNIGLPLAPQHCVLFFFSGNDFIQEPTLWSFWGLTATYPRDSLLSHMGLMALNHAITNRHRPVLKAWFHGGSLLALEKQTSEKFRNTEKDPETEAAMLSFLAPDEQSVLKKVLGKSSGASRSRFYQMLRKPDQGRFRSYYLDTALRSALGEPVPRFIAAEYSYKWVKATYDLCRKRGVGFTLVLIPDSFTVDARAAELWRPLADLKSYLQYKDEAASRLVSHARDDGMDVVDLRDVLQNTRGTYLNMDGHWSQQGVDLVAELLAKRFRLQAERPSTVQASRRQQ